MTVDCLQIMGSLYRCGAGVAASVLLAMAIGVSPSVAEEQWRVIAKKSVVFRGLIQRIDLEAANSFVRGVRVRTRGRRMIFSSLGIRYADGREHRERRRIRLDSGQASKPINLDGDGRFVDEIILIPDASAPRRRAFVVEILGLQKPEDQNRSSFDRAEPAVVESGRKLEDAASAGEVAPELPVKANRPLPAASVEFEAPLRPKPTIVLGKPSKGGDVLIVAANLRRPSDGITRIGLPERQARFAKLRIGLSGSDVFVERVVIIYDDDSRSKESLGVLIQRNTRSRWLELDDRRFIVGLEIQQRADSNRFGSARVEVLGRLANDWLSPDAAGNEDGDGWRLIAAQSGRALGLAAGVMSVASNRGGLRQLRVLQDGRMILPQKLFVRYATGIEKAVVLPQPGRKAVAATAIDLADRAPIDGLRATFRVGRGARLDPSARIEVWARLLRVV